MASEGSSYRKILAFYYPGTSVGTTARQFDWTQLGGERVVVLTTRPDADRKVLTIAENLRREWESRLDWADSREITIRIYPNLDSFRNATGEPGWIAARTSGSSIDLQPAEVLEQHHTLQGTLRHEILHALIEMHAAPGLPLWFREGLVEWLSSPGGQAARAQQISDRDLLQRTDRATAEQSYAAADARVRDLISRYGADAVLSWVGRGLPEEVKNSSVNSAATNSR